METKEQKLFHRRNLPHLHPSEGIFFITYRLAGSLPREAIERLKEARFWIYGLDTKGSRNYAEVDYRGPVALVVGGEGRGMRPLVAGRCDGTVRIPMRGKLESLNVSVATAIVLYEILRQRAGTNAFTRAVPG